ncbi:putative zinc-binding peptidase [Pseudomonas sp. R2.Fl]|nr:putative zinc-binding peptidase [Pseudomonas sp. R2.Fl]
MKPYTCSNCGNLVHFENESCVRCGMRLGYRHWRDDMVAVDAGGRVVSRQAASSPDAFFCDNAQAGVCNWLVADQSEGRLCRACRHNLMIPDLAIQGNPERWARIERAKRHVFYSLLRWGLPLPTPADPGERHLSFSFVADVQTATGAVEPAMTGHDAGHITINIVEADDAERERIRQQMAEPYRTLVGHFRHELGHFYWDVLVSDGGQLEEFRRLFGDERGDYAMALQTYYGNGAPPDWQSCYVSAYASAHPSEDFAETWAHYVHMTDGLETALSFGLRIDADGMREGDAVLDPYRAPRAEDLVRHWVPVTIALNSINRSMGQPDVYPFVLSAAVVEKLEFVHRLVQHAARADRPADALVS